MLTIPFLAVVLAASLAGVVTTLGIYSYPFINRISPSNMGNLLAISAGALVYVGASHLLPQVEKQTRRDSILAFLVGVLVAFV